eukprot:1753019-Heterocapsa_arctica.AAC.1
MASACGPGRALGASGAKAGVALQLDAALCGSRSCGPAVASCSFAGGARASSALAAGGARLQGASAAGRKAWRSIGGALCVGAPNASTRAGCDPAAPPGICGAHGVRLSLLRSFAR